MAFWSKIWALIRHELSMEWRGRFALSSILLFVATTVFIAKTAFQTLEGRTWNGIFWVIVLFATTNALSKSFLGESNARRYYYYWLVSPIQVLIAKVVYNFLLLSSLIGLAFLAFVFVDENPVKDMPLMLTTLVLAALGLSITFTFISAIAAKAKQGATLSAILGFPLIIPTLYILLKLSANALRLEQDTRLTDDISLLLGMDLVLLAATLILYPFLWRD